MHAAAAAVFKLPSEKKSKKLTPGELLPTL
jgi:hypothetical protein